MVGLQFCIGAVNDLCDHDLDAQSKPHKPIPAGIVTRPAAAAVALACGGGGLATAALYGLPVLAMAAAMLGAGLAYDFVLKRGPWSWAAYAVALPLLPLYAWWGASGQPPPRYELLLPLAALAGPALQLANGLVDVERDRRAGVTSLVAVLGPDRARALSAAIQALIHGVAWVTLAGSTVGVSTIAAQLLALGAMLAVAGIVLSGFLDERARERGWRLQATSIGLLAVAWLSAVVQPA